MSDLVAWLIVIAGTLAAARWWWRLPPWVDHMDAADAEVTRRCNVLRERSAAARAQRERQRHCPICARNLESRDDCTEDDQ